MAVRPLTLHIGTYTDGASKGIYRLDFDPETGALGEPMLAAEALNPAFLAWHPRLPVLYTVSETDTGPDRQGLVMAFAAAADGGLKALGAQQPSGGAAPCYVSVDPSGARLFVANYHGGSVAALPIDADGRLKPPSSVGRHYGASVHPVRQRKAYAHAIVPAPAAAPIASSAPARGGARAAAASGASGAATGASTQPASFALATDLGADRVLVYRIDESGQLTPHDAGMTAVARGAGPRHLAFTPAGDTLFVINELNSTIAAYTWHAARGTLELLGDPISTLPEGFTGENITAEIAVHPSGKFLYGSNRGHDSIAIFRIGPHQQITRVGLHSTHGKTPRHFAIDPTGAFLIAANQDSNSLVVFRIDRDSGLLLDTIARANVPAPACVRFNSR